MYLKSWSLSYCNTKVVTPCCCSSTSTQPADTQLQTPRQRRLAQQKRKWLETKVKGRKVNHDAQHTAHHGSTAALSVVSTVQSSERHGQRGQPPEQPDLRSSQDMTTANTAFKRIVIDKTAGPPPHRVQDGVILAWHVCDSTNSLKSRRALLQACQPGQLVELAKIWADQIADVCSSSAAGVDPAAEQNGRLLAKAASANMPDGSHVRSV
mmetsp:Transcript_39677/g.88162  ORF Transcript_39677/g.88162 Transcript_39677/m.88162 type:complete len:210 (+) Transcript_39677:83-712(+)